MPFTVYGQLLLAKLALFHWDADPGGGEIGSD
jgi:hypothetical protein